jgi:hypothetical protein
MLDTLKFWFGYRVMGFGYSKTHYTFTRREALEWVACYDEGAIVLKKHKVKFVRFSLKG